MTIRTPLLTGLLAGLAALMLFAAPARADIVTLADGVQVEDFEVGSGAEARRGRSVTVHYTGWLYVDEARGKKFDSSYAGAPLTFTLGSGEVIAGWDSGIAGMKEGGIRTLIIPPERGYGKRGKGPVPGNSWMMFEVELLKVK